MCGRFTIATPEKIPSRFNTSDKMPLFEKSYNVAPSQTLPTITRNSPNKITMMRWGYMWSKTSKHATINIRRESTKDKPYFKKILLSQRCILPADGFYEWKKVKSEEQLKKLPYYVYLENNPLFGFAGLYNRLLDAEGKPVYTFAILTCPPNKLVKKVHSRMPCILERKDEDSWLNPENKNFDKLYSFLEPYPPKNMRLHPVSKEVNNPRNDNEKLIKPFEEKKLF
ncbi:MAG: SOS response-associated peptidase [Candidatus Woesebacteria bacterium]|jgi:putative SOS response-associated peptidase YedK